MARQALAIHTELCSGLSLDEDLVADGFESFTKSQYFPNNINILIGKESQFWLLSDYAHMRRKGRMTAFQKKRNEELRPYTSINNVTIYKSFSSLVNTAHYFMMKSGRRNISLYTDEHQQYKMVMDLFNADNKEKINHIQISSKRARTLTNPLFAVNYTDREIRKDCSDHARETCQSAKNVANAMDRLAIYRMYHNFIKPFRINERNNTLETHATMAGMGRKKIYTEMKTAFTQRRFLGKVLNMSGSDLKIWCRGISTPMNRFADHLPRFALQ